MGEPGSWGMWGDVALSYLYFSAPRECPAQNQHAPGLSPRLHGNAH